MTVLILIGGDEGVSSSDPKIWGQLLGWMVRHPGPWGVPESIRGAFLEVLVEFLEKGEFEAAVKMKQDLLLTLDGYDRKGIFAEIDEDFLEEMAEAVLTGAQQSKEAGQGLPSYEVMRDLADGLYLLTPEDHEQWVAMVEAASDVEGNSYDSSKDDSKGEDCGW